MDSAKIRSLFTLFSGEEYRDDLGDFIGMAIIETTKMLRDGANQNDERLNFLAAALANYRYQAAISVRDSREYTYSGSIAGAGKSSAPVLSLSLVRDYCLLCEDIIKPSDFVFSAFSKEAMPDE